MTKNKVLIIRFSSFGDIVQCSPTVDLIAQGLGAEVHWATRFDFENLVSLNRQITKIWSVKKSEGFLGLVKLGFILRKEEFTHVYDAHNNLRSIFLKLFLLTKLKSPENVTRSKFRIKRFLLFKFRINNFPKPFKGALSYTQPLSQWGIQVSNNSVAVSWHFLDSTKSKIDKLLGEKKFIVLIPSAAWEMKRWPINYWKKLILDLPEKEFAILGGKEDLFCNEIMEVAPTRVVNFAGELSLVESCYLLTKSQIFISGDTGLLHVADVLNLKGISLIGPSAFGYTTNNKIKTIEMDMLCKPCSKDGSGSCSQSIYQKCLVDITPSLVASEVHRLGQG